QAVAYLSVAKPKPSRIGMCGSPEPKSTRPDAIPPSLPALKRRTSTPNVCTKSGNSMKQENQMTNQSNALATRPENRLNQFMRSDNIMARFEEILGERGARMYVSSVLLAVANKDALQECTHAAIVASALRAASLSLSCDPAIGQAYLVPYGKV